MGSSYKGYAERVALEFRDEACAPDTRETLDWRGVVAEHVTISGTRLFDYTWSGSSHYIALHDIALNDGEITADGAATSRVLDLRGRLTFVPRGLKVTGWSNLRRRLNSFTAVYYDRAILGEELDAGIAPGEERPLLYFEDAALRVTLGKIQSLLLNPDKADPVYAETLGLLAAIEMARHQSSIVAEAVAVNRGGLDARHEKIVLEYIAEHLREDIRLDNLAGLAGLSRFHFVRAFKKTTGLAPHQFIIRARVERAKSLLVGSDLPLKDISARVGFGSPSQFSAAFRGVAGVQPVVFRRDQR